jgi:hypothetical protein
MSPTQQQRDEFMPLVNDHHANSTTNGTFDPTDDGLDALLGKTEEADTGGIVGGLLRKRSRDTANHPVDRHRRDSSIIEIALESLHDLGDVIVENVEHAAETVHDTLEEVKEVLEEPVAVPVKPREEGDHSQKLGAVSLAILVFYKVSGGPFGSEPTVKAAGPFYAILGFIIFPFIWAIPEAMITAELGTAFPEPSGCKSSMALLFLQHKKSSNNSSYHFIFYVWTHSPHNHQSAFY